MAESIPHDRHITLVDLLDRVLDTGIAAVGDVTLSVAGIDLVYVSLRALVASIATVDELHRDAQWQRTISANETGVASSDHHAGRSGGQPGGSQAVTPARRTSALEPRTRSGLDAIDSFVRRLDAGTSLFRSRADADPEEVAKGLARLVLSLVELLRELMERQAIRRMEGGGLTEEQIERMGTTFILLRERMEELKEAFGIEEDLTIDLGPIGGVLDLDEEA